MADYFGIYPVENSKHKRTIQIKDDLLTSIRTGGYRYNIYAFEKDKFYSEHSLKNFASKKDENSDEC